MIQDLFLYLRFYNSKISAKYSSVSSVSNIGSLIKWGRTTLEMEKFAP